MIASNQKMHETAANADTIKPIQQNRALWPMEAQCWHSFRFPQLFGPGWDRRARQALNAKRRVGDP